MPNLEQERAAHAWKCVQNCGKDYVNLAKSAPALVMGNGLMQTLAFFQSKSKGKDHYSNLNSHIFSWLETRFPEKCKGNNYNNVMSFLHNSDPLKYRQATEETLEFLRWIRQFAAAVESE
ncbi:MAG: type III-B CRISPR module-associated protein Cmr5 [Deltaproteobacteria bacterium]|nr:type III-B CRISPR module-associated protein Cmr5 [Deltaproteobacteria bacterium]